MPKCKIIEKLTSCTMRERAIKLYRIGTLNRSSTTMHLLFLRPNPTIVIVITITKTKLVEKILKTTNKKTITYFDITANSKRHVSNLLTVVLDYGI